MTELAISIQGRVLRLLQGDITKVPADAIANAANAALAGGGGVDGAIHAAGGSEIMRELDAIRPAVSPLPAGQAVATGAGRLPARYVLHAVGPIWHGGAHGEPAALASCYRACLELAAGRGCASVSFPSISTGVYGYPVRLAAQTALAEVMFYLKNCPSSIEQVSFILFDKNTFDAYAESLRQTQPE